MGYGECRCCIGLLRARNGNALWGRLSTQGLPPAKWIDVANRYKTLFALLNRKASGEEVRAGFGDYQHKYFPEE